MRPASAAVAPVPKQTFSVMINGLPANITISELQSKYNEQDFVVLPADKQKFQHMWCAYLNNLTEEQAIIFTERWNKSCYASGYSITCKVHPQKKSGTKPTNVEPASANSSEQNVPIGNSIPNSFDKTRNAAIRSIRSQNVPRHDMTQQIGFPCNPAPFIPPLMSKSHVSGAAQAYPARATTHKPGKVSSHLSNAATGNIGPSAQLPFHHASSSSTLFKAANQFNRSSLASFLNVEADSKPSSPSSTRSSTPAPSICSASTEAREPCYVLCKMHCIGSCKFGKDCRYLHAMCDQYDSCNDSQCWLGHSFHPSRKLPTSKNRNQLCKHFRTGECVHADKCINMHKRCNDDCCEEEGCLFGHPFGWVPPGDIESANFCWEEATCKNFECPKRHPPERRLCKHAAKCNKLECVFLHPITRQVCSLNEQCEDYDCELAHSNARRLKSTTKTHPGSLMDNCELEADCVDLSCTKSHPPQRPKACRWKAECRHSFCPFLHPAERLVCELGALCLSAECQALHPPGRPALCGRGDACWNSNCERLHSKNWSPCDNGIDCVEWACKNVHPPDRPLACNKPRCRDKQCKLLHPDAVSKRGTQHSRQGLKTLQTRIEERERNRLPILQCQQEFCTRLENNKVLIVTAETGSGKTTQLPQYAAEYFHRGGLVVCTQPRVIAAISIAQRVAQEYDGCGAGESVGYEVGGDKVAGSDIMFMTDACLIRRSQRDASLSDVRVLIIDEAHERSLNTDIVLGIAKLVREKRKDDFYVVISSATIDPTLFAQFFGCTQSVLKVPGRTFAVTVENVPPQMNVDRGMKDSLLLDSHVLPTLKTMLGKCKQGNVLVFLPGQREIENAIKLFLQLGLDDFVALPLYGSLPSEEQSKVLEFVPTRESERMVVFCTNVAETSLTIPDVRLVMDTGLAKEARFDTARRLTVLEQVYISQSSADQRKGRAGRTAEGHCVRLFSPDKITRPNIEPEILRSSLDLVVLQLVKLRMDPLNFCYIQAPPQDALVASQVFLKEKLLCVDSSGALTKLGDLFVDLQLDPRLSAFITMGYEQFRLLEQAVKIAAILSAPGSLFFMGGADSNAKAMARRRKAEGAAEHDSDLLYQYEKFKHWESAGKVERGKCVTCGRRFDWSGCRVCRAKHSSAEGLNNKVLQVISKSVQSILQTVKKSEWFKSTFSSDSPLQEESNDIDITKQFYDMIGICLAKCFPEQVGHLLMPKDPSKECRLSSEVRAAVSATSCFSQRVKNHEFFVSMSITRSPQGVYYADNMHPLSLQPQDFSRINMVEILRDDKVGGKVYRDMSKQIEDSVWRQMWLVMDHDGKNTLVVYGLSTKHAQIKLTVEQLLAKVRSQMFNEKHTLSLPNGLTVDLKSGLQVCQILQQHQQPAPAAAVQESNPEEGDADNNNKNDRQTIWQLIVKPPLQATKADVAKKFKNSKQILPLQSKTDLLIRNLPDTVRCEDLSKIIDNGYNETSLIKFPQPVISMMPHTNAIGVQTVKITFLNVQQRDLAAALLRRAYAGVWSPIVISKNGVTHAKQVAPEIHSTQTRYAVSFASCQAAEDHYVKFNNSPEADDGWVVYGNSYVTVQHSELFNNLQEMCELACLDTAAKHHTVKLSDTSNGNSVANQAVRVVFDCASPSDTSRAAAKLQTCVSYIQVKYRFLSHKDSTLLRKVDSLGLLDDWAAELGLKCEKLEDPGFNLHGPKVNQGQFMRKIADRVQELECNYQLISLKTAARNVLRKNRSGDVRLDELQKRHNACSIDLLFYTSDIALFSDDAEALSVCKKDVLKLLEDLGVSEAGDNQSQLSQCVFCGAKANRRLTICGHAYCSCLQDTQALKRKLPLYCSTCATPVYLQDLNIDLRGSRSLQDPHKDVIYAAIRQHLNDDDSNKFCMCVNDTCDGVLTRSAGYQRCLQCKKSICTFCKVIDDELHLGVSCQAYANAIKLSEETNDLYSHAESFVKNNWPVDLGSITLTERNPGLPRCPAFKKFQVALQRLGHGRVSSRLGIFAFHGTTEQAMIQICHDGFDPKLRKGQAYGLGEYFGITANVSDGYCKEGCKRMIIAFLLHSPAVKSVKNFCYVVENPTDDSFAYNLPVLVVSYGNHSDPFPFIKPVAAVQETCEKQAAEPSDFEEDLVIPKSKWVAPFRWYWQKDIGAFEPYNEAINKYLEENYEKFSRGGPKSVITEPLLRYVDDKPQTYEIDYARNLQFNTATRYQRRLKRERTDMQLNNCSWYYDDISGSKKYDSLVQHQIEREYQSYLTGTGLSKFVCSFPGRPEKYELDFIRGTQTNKTSLQERRIYRQ